MHSLMISSDDLPRSRSVFSCICTTTGAPPPTWTCPTFTPTVLWSFSNGMERPMIPSGFFVRGLPLGRTDGPPEGGHHVLSFSCVASGFSRTEGPPEGGHHVLPA